MKKTKIIFAIALLTGFIAYEKILTIEKSAKNYKNRSLRELGLIAFVFGLIIGLLFIFTGNMLLEDAFFKIKYLLQGLEPPISDGTGWAMLGIVAIGLIIILVFSVLLIYKLYCVRNIGRYQSLGFYLVISAIILMIIIILLNNLLRPNPIGFITPYTPFIILFVFLFVCAIAIYDGVKNLGVVSALIPIILLAIGFFLTLIPHTVDTRSGMFLEYLIGPSDFHTKRTLHTLHL